MLTLKLFTCHNAHCKVCNIYPNHLNSLSTLVQCNFRTVSKTVSVRLIQADIKQNLSDKRNHNKKGKKQELKWLAFIFWFPVVSKTARNTLLNADFCVRSTINCTKYKHDRLTNAVEKCFLNLSLKCGFGVFLFGAIFVYLFGVINSVLCLENKHKHTIYLCIKSDLSV